jgi:hypothetical protein
MSLNARDHLLRRMNVFVTAAPADLHQELLALLQRHRPSLRRSGTYDLEAPTFDTLSAEQVEVDWNAIGSMQPRGH